MTSTYNLKKRNLKEMKLWISCSDRSLRTQTRTQEEQWQSHLQLQEEQCSQPTGTKLRKKTTKEKTDLNLLKVRNGRSLSFNVNHFHYQYWESSQKGFHKSSLFFCLFLKIKNSRSRLCLECLNQVILSFRSNDSSKELRGRQIDDFV